MGKYMARVKEINADNIYSKSLNLLNPTGHVMHQQFNPLKTTLKLLYLKAQFVPHIKHFSSRLQKPISL